MAHTSLQRRLRLVVALTTASALFVACAALVVYDVLTFRRGMVSNFTTLAELVATHSIAGLAQGETASAEASLLALAAHPQVRAAALYQSGGELLARYTPDYDDLEAIPKRPGRDGHVFAEDDFELFHPVVASGRRLGTVYLRASTAEARARALRVLAIGAGSMLLALGGGLVVASRLHRRIAEPLGQLVEASARIARGELAAPVRAEGSDEVGRLADSFREMAASLRRLLGDVSESVRDVARVAEDLGQSSARVAQSARQQDEALDTSGQVATGIDASANGVVAHVEQLLGASHDAASSMVQMDSAVQEIAAHMDHLATMLDGASSATDQLSAGAREIAERVGSLRHATDATSRAVGSLHTSVDEVRERGARCRELSNEAAHEAERGEAAVRQTIEAMHTIGESFRRLEARVSSLSARSQSIGEILRVIDGVTERTRLLALNASVIAAQAAEHGRAFAVVATEIQALADQTSSSTHAIAEVVRGVQTEIEESVAAVGAGAERVDSGARLSAEAGEVLAALNRSAKASSDIVAEIVAATDSQMKGLGAVEGAMRLVGDFVLQIDNTAQEQHAASARVGELVGQIRSVGQDVKRSTSEQSQETKHVMRMVRTVADMIEQIGAAAAQQQAASEQLQQALDVFRRGTAEGSRCAVELELIVQALSERSASLARSAARFAV